MLLGLPDGQSFLNRRSKCQGMRVWKKIIIVPVYLVYYVWFEWILGCGMKDPWDNMIKWAKK